MNDTAIDPPRRILVSRLRFMGDVILTTPFVRALARRFPDARIDYLAESPYGELLQNNPYLHQVVTAPGRDSSVMAQAAFLTSLRKAEYDVYIDLFGNPRSALLGRLVGAQVRVGGPHRVRKRLYTHLVVQNPAEPDAIAFHLKYLESLGAEPDGKKTEVHLTAAELDEARTTLGAQFSEETETPLVGVHPGATWPNKKWMPEHFIELAQRLKDELGARIVVTAGPDEEELQAQVAEATGAVAMPGAGLRTLGSILSQFDLFVSNDCGPMHLAVAVDTPTLGIFGPGQPHIWFPYEPGDGHVALMHPIDCRPCHADECPLRTLDCMKLLKPEVVFEAAAAILERRTTQKAAATTC